jgi:hypothetical protein
MKSLDQMHRDFGAFYPTGHMVVAFQDEADAIKIQNELKSQGQVFADTTMVSSELMTEFARKNLTEASFIADLGTSVLTVQSFLDAARKGATFLIVATPNNEAAERVSVAIHHVSFVLAERYHILAIESVS